MLAAKAALATRVDAERPVTKKIKVEDVKGYDLPLKVRFAWLG
jgi:hypothetical protein